MPAPTTASPLAAPIAVLAVLVLGAAPVRANPWEFVRVGDPIEAELRILEVAGPDSATARRLKLPHLGLRPLQWIELQGDSPPARPRDPATSIAVARIERALAREAAPGFAPHPEFRSTPRLVDTGSLGARMSLSLGVTGGGEWEEDDTRFASGSGVRGVLGVEVDRWLYHSDLLIGKIADAESFADPLVKDTELILHTEDTWLAWSAADARWSVLFGRTRWHWGPGEEGSLALSRTSAALTGFSYRVGIPALRAEVTALSATLGTSAGEQLAAHRVEWHPHPALRFGLTETARYASSTWQPLYLVGAIPYVLVQRLQAQDEPDSSRALRNNVQMAADAAWRVAPGTRVYAEVLVDDLHTRTGRIPDKLGWQIGWEGVGAIGAHRVTWGGELTRLSRFVYTSFFGRDHEAQGLPIGFPTGPDARRVRLRLAVDPNVATQLYSHLTLTDRGESGLDIPFEPGVSPSGPDIWKFAGVAERTRVLEVGVRYWPASGVDVAAGAGYRWRENVGHEAGRDHDAPFAAFRVTLMR